MHCMCFIVLYYIALHCIASHCLMHPYFFTFAPLQSIFGTGIERVCDKSDEEVYAEASSIAVDLHRKFLENSYAPPAVHTYANHSDHYSAMNLLSHLHFVGYGGGYYCYTFSKMCAAHLWESNLASDPLSRRAGMLLYDKIFSKGGALTAEEVLSVELLGQESVDPSIYLKNMT
jgi:Zn-dependent oligopeptidase